MGNVQQDMSHRQLADRIQAVDTKVAVLEERMNGDLNHIKKGMDEIQQATATNNVLAQSAVTSLGGIALAGKLIAALITLGTAIFGLILL